MPSVTEPFAATPAIILAAGASHRLGHPKQLVTLGGETLLDRTVRVVQEARCQPLVVLGCRAAEIAGQCRLDGVETVRNPDWETGMASSIRAGAAALAGRDFAVLLVLCCDQPAVDAGHLQQLVHATSVRGEGAVFASAYAGRRGVPACFGRAELPKLLKLQGDTGARDLLREAETIALRWGELDIDTPESLQEARLRFGGGGAEQAS